MTVLSSYLLRTGGRKRCDGTVGPGIARRELPERLNGRAIRQGWNIESVLI